MGYIETRHVSDTWKCGSLSFSFTHPPEDLKKKEKKESIISSSRSRVEAVKSASSRASFLCWICTAQIPRTPQEGRLGSAVDDLDRDLSDLIRLTCEILHPLVAGQSYQFTWDPATAVGDFYICNICYIIPYIICVYYIYIIYIYTMQTSYAVSRTAGSFLYLCTLMLRIP